MKKMLHASLVAIIVLLATSVSAQQLPARHPANQSLRNEIVKQRLQQSIAQSETADPASTALPPLGAVPTNVDDSLALVALYNATNGGWWNTNSNWKETIVSLWKNVTVSNGRVTSLILENNNLVGEIPELIGNLTALKTLMLSGNQLSGTLPSTFWNLTSLENLKLSNNQLSGSIPDGISNLTNLKYLYLDNNLFTNNFPTTLGQLQDINELNISNNNFSGEFPSTISNINMIWLLKLSNNQFTGNILNNLTNHIFLMNIEIADNQFYGDIPNEFGNFEYLETFYVEDNAYTFSSIEPIFSWPNYSYISAALTYSPQADVGTGDTVTLAAGLPLRISITGYTPAAHDEFQWYHNETLLPAAADSFIAIPAVAAGDAGNYRCEITNTVATALTLHSKNFRLEVGSGGENTPPVANAGPDQTVDEGTLVTLNGTASSDADSDPLTYEWTAPEGITLSDNTLAQPTFTAPTVATSTTYEFSLVVNDGTVNSLPDIVVITVSNVNTAPAANAGPDQTVDEGTLVTLNGTASSDADSDPLTYLWTAPAGITLSDNTLAQPTFTAPTVATSTTYEFSLVVNDGTVNSLPDIVVITVNPTATVPPTLTITNYTLPEAEVECFNAQQTITVTGTEGPVTFENNSVATLIAGQNIVFMPGFHAVAGSNVHAYISDVFCIPAPIMAQPEEKSALVDIEEDNNTLGSEEKSIKVFPNPSEGLVSIALSNYSEPALVNVYSLQGKSVASILVNATATIDLGHLQKGLYIVKVSSNDDMTTKKLMLK